MLQVFKNGQTSIVLRVKVLDSSVSTGAGLTGLTSASSGLRIATIADNEAAATAYTVAGSTIETITTLGTFAAPTATKCRFKEVDATNHPGVYELHIADARFAVANAKSLLVSLSGATNAAQTDFVVQLQTDDPYVAKLDAAATRTALGLSSANLDTQLAAIAGFIDTEIGTLTTNVAAVPAAVGALVVEGAITLLQSLRLANAALGGKASGLGTSTAVFRDLGDTKDRITATVDADGNRSAVTRDLT